MIQIQFFTLMFKKNLFLLTNQNKSEDEVFYHENYGILKDLLVKFQWIDLRTILWILSLDFLKNKIIDYS